MRELKQQLKKFIPQALFECLINPYHLVEAFAANVRYGFPASSMRVVMITGTNGKTSTAAYVGKILRASGRKVGTYTTAFFDINGEQIPNNLNATIDSTFELQKMLARMKKAGVEDLVLEVTSHSLLQHRTWGIPCDVAVMTNLTQDHLDYHKTMENYAAAKGKLFARRPRFIVLNRDDEWFEFFNKYPAGELKMTYGSHEAAECRIVGANMHKQGTDVTLQIDHQTEIKFATRLAGKFNVYNATAAAAATYMLHVDIEHIVGGIESLEAIPGRLEHVPVKKPYDIIVDYAHTPDALHNLLETLKNLTKNRVILVFGATGDRDKEKRPLMGEIAANFADRIILTDEETYSENPDQIREMVMQGIEQEGGGAKTEEIADRKAAIEKALSIARPGDTVIITGMGHERFRVMDGKKIAWNDAEVVQDILN